MFLIEGQGKAILYTGDIRAEPWFVNALARNPIILEYTCGLKTIDKMYLDTSFLDDIPFQTKCEGISDLLAKVRKYPEDTVFHIQAWTFGYEDVWIALSKALHSRVRAPMPSIIYLLTGQKIHVDDYKLRIFNSLKSRLSDQPFTPEFHLASGAAMLTGHMCGNTQHQGCLTSDTHVRIHSCEKANMCSVARHHSVVSIRPVVCRLPGGEAIMEAGVGGGGTDFFREAELDYVTNEDIDALLESLPIWKELDSQIKYDIKALLTGVSLGGRDLSLNMGIEHFGEDLSADMSSLVRALVKRLRGETGVSKTPVEERPDTLPKVILFPFARHSPYRELCELVKAFAPKDIWPCTVTRRWIDKEITVESLFGKYCSEQLFEHDKQMAPLIAQEQDKKSREAEAPVLDSQRTECDSLSLETTPKGKCIQGAADTNRPQPSSASSEVFRAQSFHSMRSPPPKEPDLTGTTHRSLDPKTTAKCHDASSFKSKGDGEAGHDDKPNMKSRKRPRLDSGVAGDSSQDATGTDSQMTGTTVDSASSPGHCALRQDAYNAMLNNIDRGDPWLPISLLSTDGNHHDAEAEL
ncbi:hypothetical protein NOR_00135 [Metarhizium rileyi]|uniref:DNA repair metallo-beta-lactamase domain-containing protein n=1 Tax=Metarhizium rileyi (strain RCEF 4871) TaxID=1649241 RepID=A0A167KCK2_METRR|nr:hypothetical protein NOR_00135 [Metarhizium rileyi RCEF 4871]